MNGFRTLQQYLEDWATGDANRTAISVAVQAIAATGIEVSELIARGSLAGAMHQVVGDNADGDAQKQLDVVANEMFMDALKGTAVGPFGSEENDGPMQLNEGGTLTVAMDPLDGSSNIDTNVSIGTIFSILPVISDDLSANLLQPGTAQVAGGFVIFGPQTAVVLSVGNGTHIFTLDRATRTYQLGQEGITLPTGKREYAINASNYNYWDEALRAFIDDCISDADTTHPGGRFNMRWIASLVAESYRILVRGGIFLYPRDQRPGYQHGRLRLMYEANPIALLIEQAGGAATDGTQRILEIVPTDFHQRVPLVFGDREKVEKVVQYHNNPHTIGDRAPLFARRGLFRS